MWIWQHEDWPNYEYDASVGAERARAFFLKNDRLTGRLEGLSEPYRWDAAVDLLLAEAIKTSAIEGEYLDRESVRSSILSLLGRTAAGGGKAPTDEKAAGVAALIVDVRRHWDQPLTEEVLHRWQGMVLPEERSWLRAGMVRGAYRNHPMQVVSGAVVHYEAPPPERVRSEMDRFLAWYASTDSKDPRGPAPGPLKAGIAHLWFEQIHPFEDGNGRVGRAVADHALSQCLGRPTLVCLAAAIEKNRKQYYRELQRLARGGVDLDPWLGFFMEQVDEAADIARRRVDFVLTKARFYERHGEGLTPRQAKAVARMFAAGDGGFEGGMTNRKYQAITRCSMPTATRDLADLAARKILVRRPGGGRSTSYDLGCLARGPGPPDDESMENGGLPVF